MKSHFLRLAIALALITQGCIPIEDVVSPTILTSGLGNEELTAFYFGDTLRFQLSLQDNDALDSLVVRITQNSANPSDSAFTFTEELTIASQFFQNDYAIPIPLYRDLTPGQYYQTGEYQVEIKSFDAGDNANMQTVFFELKADSTKPTLQDIAIDLDTSLSAGIDYIACRSERLSIRGFARDNLLLDQVTFTLINDGSKLSEFTYGTEVFGDSSLSLAEVVGNDLSVPQSLLNDEVLLMVVTARDAFFDGSFNETKDTVTILIECDDQSPTIAFEQSIPSISSNQSENVAKVILGEDFILRGLTIQDNYLLERVLITYNLESDPLTTAFDSIGVLADSLYLDAISFTIPRSADLSDVYEVNIFAFDTAGNAPGSYAVRINPIENKLPVIEVTEIAVDGSPISFSSIAANPVPAGGRISVNGKIEDDYLIQSIRVSWGPNGSESIIADLTDVDDAVVSISDLFSNVAIPPTALSGERYRLIISVDDLPFFGSSQVSIFTFVVE